MENTQIEPTYSAHEKSAKLEVELDQSRRAQLDAEAELAQEQAAVNSFRMHCRLKLDQLVDSLMELRVEKQKCLTQLELLNQGIDAAWLDEDEFLGENGEDLEEDVEEEDLILPTPTPHDKAAEKRLYREMARRFHPDLARTAVELSYRTTMMAAVNSAYASDDLQAMYDLAGELEPGEISELAGIENLEIRRLREGIMNARQKRRKATRQLTLLRRENTARLWRRAQAIEGQGQDWWSLVQSELGHAVRRLELEVIGLQSQIENMEQESA